MHKPAPYDSTAARSARPPAEIAAVDAVLREARRLHHAATSDSLATSLPVLRRLLASGALQSASLPELFRRRAGVQRKHVLRMLAREAGFDSWEAWRPTLDSGHASALMQEHALRRDTGTLHLWFRSEAEAHAFADRHGGTPVRLGAHAVVAPAQALEIEADRG